MKGKADKWEFQETEKSRQREHRKHKEQRETGVTKKQQPNEQPNETQGGEGANILFEKKPTVAWMWVTP